MTTPLTYTDGETVCIGDRVIIEGRVMSVAPSVLNVVVNGSIWPVRPSDITSHTPAPISPPTASPAITPTSASG